MSDRPCGKPASYGGLFCFWGRIGIRPVLFGIRVCRVGIRGVFSWFEVCCVGFATFFLGSRFVALAYACILSAAPLPPPRKGRVGARPLHPRALGDPAESLHAPACPLTSSPGFSGRYRHAPSVAVPLADVLSAHPALRLRSAMIFTLPPLLQIIGYVRK